MLLYWFNKQYYKKSNWRPSPKLRGNRQATVACAVYSAGYVQTGGQLGISEYFFLYIKELPSWGYLDLCWLGRIVFSLCWISAEAESMDSAEELNQLVSPNDCVLQNICNTQELVMSAAVAHRGAWMMSWLFWTINGLQAQTIQCVHGSFNVFLTSWGYWRGDVEKLLLTLLPLLQIAFPSNFACHRVFRACFPNRKLGTIKIHMNDLGSSSMNGNDGIKANPARQIVIEQAGWMGGSSTSITLYSCNSNSTRCSVRVYFWWLYFEEYFPHDAATIAVVKMSHNDCRKRLKFQCSNIGHIPFDYLSFSLDLLESKQLSFIRRWVKHRFLLLFFNQTNSFGWGKK